jgi:post-segregation antitoxin (ccd killing protein)
MAKPRKTDLQIRGLPVVLREKLRRRAVGKGVSMSQYVTELLKDDLALPTIDEWLEETKDLPRIDLAKLGISTPELMRQLDEERTEEIVRRTSFSTRRRRSTT